MRRTSNCSQQRLFRREVLSLTSKNAKRTCSLNIFHPKICACGSIQQKAYAFCYREFAGYGKAWLLK